MNDISMPALVRAALPVYLSADLSLWCVVDPEDHAWCVQHVWNAKPRAALSGLHWYAKRNVGPARVPVYLHREICERAHGPAPSDRPLTDHRNGNTLDCRRVNLRWVNHRTNSLNLGGQSFCIEPVQAGPWQAPPGW